MSKAMDERATFYSGRLRERLGANLKKIILFGSRARGDFNEGSDYDFAVILGVRDRQIRDIITEVEVEFLNKYDMLSASLIYDETEWVKRKRLPIGINIEREGISL
jgi:predicted nucleotidyltransferase